MPTFCAARNPEARTSLIEKMQQNALNGETAAAGGAWRQTNQKLQTEEEAC
jgi:hypothetical protein